jgi:hypothetical protein
MAMPLDHPSLDIHMFKPSCQRRAHAVNENLDRHPVHPIVIVLGSLLIALAAIDLVMVIMDLATRSK